MAACFTAPIHPLFKIPTGVASLVRRSFHVEGQGREGGSLAIEVNVLGREEVFIL